MEILVYIPNETSRINFVFKHICKRVLRLDVKFTTKVEPFIAFKGIKFSYAKKQLGKEVFVEQNGLLNEQGFSDMEIKVHDWDGIPCFFKTSSKSSIPFDIFSASFYLLTRYEEYQPYVKDNREGFPIEESIAYQNDFIDRPVVDEWALKFRELLKEKFPKQVFPERKAERKSIIAVEEVFAYAQKGFVRQLGGFFKDLSRLHFKFLLKRIISVLRYQSDPLNVYDDIVDFYKSNKLPMHFMFQLSNYSRYSKNLSYNRTTYQRIIKSIGDHATLGLLLGFEAVQDQEILIKEKKRWEQIVNEDLDNVLIKRHSINFPDAYKTMEKLNLSSDYSMGYKKTPGFRAGTCTPFLFYDLDLEQLLPLTIYPSAFNSIALEGSDSENVIEQIRKLKRRTERVNGFLLGIFENKDFADNFDDKIAKEIIQIIHEQEL